MGILLSQRVDLYASYTNCRPVTVTMSLQCNRYALG